MSRTSIPIHLSRPLSTWSWVARRGCVGIGIREPSLYAKIFTQIFDSSIADNWKTRHVFEDLLKLADINGVVDMTREAIAARTRLPLEMVTEAIAELEKPDPESRTPDHEGRRIARLDEHRTWGWLIVNYDRFRQTASEEQRREKTKLRTQKWRGKRPETHSDAPVTLGDASDAMQKQRERHKQRDLGSEGGGDVVEWEKAKSWWEDWKKNGADYTEFETRGAFLALQANGWMWGRNPVTDPRAALERQIQTDRERKSHGGKHTHQQRNKRNEGVAGVGQDDYGAAAKRKVEQQVAQAENRQPSKAQGTGT